MTTLAEFYSERTIFVTGGTGFMGKVLLEKMLRSVPGIKRIYLLLREKRGLAPEKRIQAITSKLPFTFKNIDPSHFKKLVAIHGDITKENLGLSCDDRQKIIEEVSVVFHLAASIRMDMSLKSAIIQNTLSTQKVLDLCTQIRNLVSVLHLSTAYCNVDQEYMEEKIYPVSFDPYKTMELIDWLDDECLEKIEKKIIAPHPNSYTYSKRLAEIIAWDMGNRLPLTIVRPSIVIPSLKEPVPGWVDSINGMGGLLGAAGKGVLRTMLVDARIEFQVFPVDLAINGMIIAAYLRAAEKFEETPVYNFTQGDVVKVSLQEALDKFRSLSFRYPFKQMLWYPGGFSTTSPIVFYVAAFFLHMIPAYFVDFLLILLLQKPFLVNIQNRLSVGMTVVSYFALRQFEFGNANTLKLDGYLNEEERKNFVVNSDEYDVDDYIEKAYFGGKKYIFNDYRDDSFLCAIQSYFFYFLDIIFKAVLLYGLTWYILYAFEATYLLSWEYWIED